jgi:L-serine dehydratase
LAYLRPYWGLVHFVYWTQHHGCYKAINAAELALETDPKNASTLDKVVNTMWETAKDMNNKYKETSEGGLAIAVNMADC